MTLKGYHAAIMLTWGQPRLRGGLVEESAGDCVKRSASSKRNGW